MMASDNDWFDGDRRRRGQLRQLPIPYDVTQLSRGVPSGRSSSLGP